MRVKLHSKPQKRIQWWSSILRVHHHLPKDRLACKCRCIQLTSISVYTPPETPIPAELVLLVQSLQDAPTTEAHILMWTGRDSLLARVVRHIMEGWSKTSDNELRPYWTQTLELSTHKGCVLRGDSSTWQRAHAN